MASFVPEQDEDAATGTAFGQTAPIIPSAPLLITAKTTLDQDKATVFVCWLAIGAKDDTLRRKYCKILIEMRDEPSDDVSEWRAVAVERGRVTKLRWQIQSLSGTIPAEIGALCALRFLYLYQNKLTGPITPTIGALTNHKSHCLDCNPLSGVVPSTLSNLTNLEDLQIRDNVLTNAPTNYLTNLYNRREVQDYMMSAPLQIILLHTYLC